MALKNLFDMVKADRYTADGREALIKAQEAETEDATRRTYQIGEISQSTGLQKTANGWVKPKNGAGRNHGTEQKKRGPGAIHTPGKGSVGMDKMKEAAEKGLKGQELKEFMTGAKSEPGPDRDDSPERAAYERELSRQQAQRSEAYKRGEKLAKPADQRQSAGYRYWQGVLSGYDDESLLEQRKSLQEQVDDFEYDIKRYDKQDMANAVYAKRIDAKNFQIGALKAIDEEMENRGMDPAPRTSVPDAAPRVLTGDCRIRIRKEKPALTGDTKIRVRK